MLETNIEAPDFSLPDQAGIVHQLTDYRGRYVLLYFYPKDNTPGCTKEACAIRDAWTEFESAGLSVLGVSADSISSHEKFVNKHGLPFPLLSDSEKVVINAYRASSGLLGTKRISYLIGPDGVIARAYPKVRPDEHATAVLADLESLKK